MTPEQLQILQHALGVDKYGQGAMSRNYFCAGEKDVMVCIELVAMGYMKTFHRSWLPYYNCTVTAVGKAAMLAESPKPPKLTRGQKRYRSYLNWKDVWGGSFREFLEEMKRREAAL